MSPIFHCVHIVIIVHFIALDDIGKVGDLVTRAGIKGKANIVPHILHKVDPATLQKEQYGFIKAIQHNDEYMVCIHGNFTVKCASFTDAISKAIMLYFVFHVTYPKQADATYKFLAALFGASYELTNEKALKILGKKLRAKK